MNQESIAKVPSSIVPKKNKWNLLEINQPIYCTLSRHAREPDVEWHTHHAVITKLLILHQCCCTLNNIK